MKVDRRKMIIKKLLREARCAPLQMGRSSGRWEERRKRQEAASDSATDDMYKTCDQATEPVTSFFSSLAVPSFHRLIRVIAAPPSSARRPLHPTQYPRTQGPPRLAPSAPRALREGIGYVPSPLYGGGGGVQNAPYFAPRGPSADRDRDRGRDWGRDRGDSERAWIPGPSRGRGRGTWGR